MLRDTAVFAPVACGGGINTGKRKRVIRVGMLASAFLLVTQVFLTGNSSERRVQSDEIAEAVQVPIIMYHSVVQSGAYSDYIIDTATLRSDLAYLREHGYEAVLVRDLIAYVHMDVELPEKPVVLTFDDGMVNNILYVLPLLEEYGMKGVFAIVGEYTERFSALDDRSPTYAYMTWKDVGELAASGSAEIANHSYGLHSLGNRRGSMRKSGESAEAYTSLLADDLARLQQALEQNAGVLPLTFAYPYGLVSPESVPVVKEAGFYASLGCAEKGNLITKDPECLFRLGRYNRTQQVRTQDFMARVLG